MNLNHLLFLLFIGLVSISCKSTDTEEKTGESISIPTETPKGIAYKLDAPRSELKWTGFKPTSSHFGEVPLGNGTIYIDGDLITGGTVEIKMSELTVLDIEGEKRTDLENHLKGTTPGQEDHFFDVQKHPTATFTILNSKKLENDPVGTHQINGALTIKDITHPISFKAVVDMSSGVALKATAEPFVIDRSKWDIKYKSKAFYDNLNDKFILDEIRFELTIGAVKV